MERYKEMSKDEPLGVLTCADGLFVIGAVYEVNGPGAEEHTAQVTTWEIEQLCKIWVEWLRDIDFQWEAWGSGGSTELRVAPFARQRLDYFTGLIGEDKVASIVAEVYADFETEIEKERMRLEVEE